MFCQHKLLGFGDQYVHDLLLTESKRQDIILICFQCTTIMQESRAVHFTMFAPSPVVAPLTVVPHEYFYRIMETDIKRFQYWRSPASDPHIPPGSSGVFIMLPKWLEDAAVCLEIAMAAL